MPKFWLGVLCGVLICCVLVIPGMTQQQAEQIEIGGVPLQVGMAKDVALNRITEHGLTLQKEQSDEKFGEMLLVIDKNDVLGQVAFTNSRLSWASRSWDSEDAGAAKLARRFHYLLNSFEKQGNTSCTIVTHEKQSPEWDSNGVEIQCGKRTAMLSVSAYKGQRPEAMLDETIK